VDGMKKCCKFKGAFTLIELSIVLVIIGLIVGGILVGRDLIHAAEIRTVISEREKIVTAINTFKLKYNAIPGDMANAESFWGSDASCPATPTNTIPKTATCNGNGDGLLGFYNTSTAYEQLRFWQHLANAELIWGQYTGARSTVAVYGTIIGVNVPRSNGMNKGGWSMFPVNRLPPWATYYANYYNNILFLGANDGTSDVTYQPLMTALDAFTVDTKIDNGAPGSGKVQTMPPNWFPNCASSNNITSATYVVTGTSIACALLFDEKF
jgi:prepilin-type N-terminal cleavage/methylation domain-containing protein